MREVFGFQGIIGSAFCFHGDDLYDLTGGLFLFLASTENQFWLSNMAYTTRHVWMGPAMVGFEFTVVFWVIWRMAISGGAIKACRIKSCTRPINQSINQSTLILHGLISKE